MTIPDSVTSVGYRAFTDCSSLASVTIPDSVTSIGDQAFYGCSSLTSIEVVGGKHADLLHLVGRVGDVGAVNEGARMLERPGGLGLVVGVVQHQRVFVGVVEIA